MLQNKFTNSINTNFLEPLVSIGIPSYNCSSYILETLESVKNQTYPNIELVIIDDCSTDDSVEIITKWLAECDLKQVSFHCNHANLGVVKTCNLLLNEFSGKYYTLLGSDDILLPTKTEQQVKIFQTSDEALAVIYSDAIVINENSEIIQDSYFKRIGLNELPQGMLFSKLLQINFIPALSVLIRTSFVKKIKGYDETLSFEDWDMWLILSLRYKFYGMPACTAKYRIHTKSVMQKEENMIRLNRSYIDMYRKYLGRSLNFDAFILNKIQKHSIYLYYKGDRSAHRFLMWSFKRSFSIKVFIYFLLAVLGIRLTISKVRIIQ